MNMAKRKLIYFFVAILSSFSAWATPSDADYERLGLQLIEDINNGNYDTIASYFDGEAFALRAARTLSDDTRGQRSFAAGVSSVADQLPQRVFSDVTRQQGVLKFMRVQELGGHRGPLLRIDFGDAGLNYLFFYVVEDGDTVKFADIFLGNTGQWLTDRIGAIGQLVVNPNQTILDRLFGADGYDPKLVLSTISEVGELYRSGEFEKAYRAINRLPDVVRNNKAIVDISIQLSQGISESVYDDELRRLAKYHSEDPAAVFMLIDYYILVEEYERGDKAIDTLMGEYGEDGILYMLKASFRLLDEDQAGVAQYTTKGIEVEPDYENNYWLKFEAHVQLEQFSEAVDTLKLLEERFDYYFTVDNFSEDSYQKFANSNAYRSWFNADD